MHKQKSHIDETAKKKRLIFRLDFLSIIFLFFVNTNSLIVTHSFVYPMWNVKQFFFFWLLLHDIYLDEFLLDLWYEMSLR